ncbi:MAG TPA: hypothetical protein DCY75_01815 [Clostridiales bacterium]|nr:hypothetical protein [Clostridiales bacterium]
METAVWSSYFCELSPEDMVLAFKKNGFHYSELSDEHGWMLINRGGDVKETGRKFKAFADANEVYFPQGHLWLKCRICAPEREQVIKTMLDWLDLFLACGIKNAVLHCDSMRDIVDANGVHVTYSEKEVIAKNAEMLRIFCQHLHGTDMTICLENLIEGFRSVESLMEVVNRVQDNHLGICLDTSHLNLSDRNPGHFIRTAGTKLKALHISDNDYCTDQHMMPFGRGNVDFTEVVKALREVGYGGIYNLEILGERKCPMKIKEMKLEFIRSAHDFFLKII